MNNRQRGQDFKRRTIAMYSEQGYLCADVEKFNPRTFQSQDMFEILDLVMVGQGETLGIQVTSKDNMSTRARKIADSPNTAILRKANWRLLIVGFYKLGARWHSVTKDVS